MTYIYSQFVGAGACSSKTRAASGGSSRRRCDKGHPCAVAVGSRRGLGEVIFFTVFDPQELYLFGEPLS